MNTLICWNNGLNLAFFQVPSALCAKYMHVNGVCISKEHEDDQTHRTIEHLAVMLGEHEMATPGGSVPTLDEFLGERHGDAPARKQRKKIAEGPWKQYEVGPNMEIDNCERILHTGWFDLEAAEAEAIESSATRELATVGNGGRGTGSAGSAVGGDGRGEVKNPATDKRLAEHGGGKRGRQSGPAAGKGRQGDKKK